jgi:hypothetical protein
MYEIRAYRHLAKPYVGGNKVRIATIKKSGKWFGFFAWMRLWFTLKKLENKKREERREIATDCSPAHAL